MLAGLALGSAGLLTLVGPGSLFGGERFHLGACLVLVVGTFAWAGGSLFSRGSRLPASPVMATAATLLAGGALLALAGAAAGELSGFDPAAVSAKSVLATVYLFVFGSIVGFSAYLWLLRVDDGVSGGDVRLRQSDRGRAPRVGARRRGPDAARLRRRGGHRRRRGPDHPRTAAKRRRPRREGEDFGCTKAPETLHA